MSLLKGPTDLHATLCDNSASVQEMSEFATFGAGCFWGVQQIFDQVDGVIASQVGYMGGFNENPTYKQVCTDTTGHAEVVHVEFDPQKVSFRELVDLFWRLHDPTTLNRQGPDYGSQYRSVIFVHSDEQKQIAEESKAALDASGKLDRKVVTKIEPAPAFWPAEDYHQKYFDKRGMGGCHILRD